MTLAQAFAPLVDLVYPPRCPLCGGGLAVQQGLCAECWNLLAIPGEPSCALCQRPFGEGEYGEDRVCAPCMANPPRHDGIAAGTLYNDSARRLVLQLKYGRKLALAPIMARLIAARAVAVDKDWLVVPVPLHRWRLWRRGFNQAGLLAREIAKMRGARLLVDGLERRKPTPSLGGLGRKARARALSGAIRVNPRRAEQIGGRPVLLVDDVLTSGATSAACVAALRKARAGQIVIGCFARVLDEALPFAEPGIAAKESARNAGFRAPA